MRVLLGVFVGFVGGLALGSFLKNQLIADLIEERDHLTALVSSLLSHRPKPKF